jgi:AAHS family benzoate transporter-like MFS transporter
MAGGQYLLLQQRQSLLIPMSLETDAGIRAVSYSSGLGKPSLARLAGLRQSGLPAEWQRQICVHHPDAQGGTPIRQLFSQGRGLSTFMFWLSCFICLFMVYALSSWLTTLMTRAGYSTASALTLVLMMNFGGMLGAIVSGQLADRLGTRYVLIGMYLVAAVSISLLGQPGLPSSLPYILVCLSGATTIGTQNLLNAYAAQFYPADARTTGVGWMLGAGRTGGILAPIAIGALVSSGHPFQECFWAIGLPSLVAVFSILLIKHRSDPPATAEVTGAPMTGRTVNSRI